MYELLHLFQRLDRGYWRIVECCQQRVRTRIIERACEISQRCGQFVADKNGKAAFVPVIFRFEADLDLGVFV